MFYLVKVYPNNGIPSSVISSVGRVVECFRRHCELVPSGGLTHLELAMLNWEDQMRDEEHVRIILRVSTVVRMEYRAAFTIDNLWRGLLPAGLPVDEAICLLHNMRLHIYGVKEQSMKTEM